MRLLDWDWPIGARLSDVANGWLPAADVFPKPFDPRELVVRLRKALGP